MKKEMRSDVILYITDPSHLTCSSDNVWRIKITPITFRFTQFSHQNYVKNGSVPEFCFPQEPGLHGIQKTEKSK